MFKKLFGIIFFAVLTVTTQIGGVAFLLARLLSKISVFRSKGILLFLFSYTFLSFGVVPLVAPLFGRVQVVNNDKVKPTSYLTVLLNRNYVRPELNDLLSSVALNLPDRIELRYLDANFPFIDGFPLLPHLSHNDGKKIDLSFIYTGADGKLSNKKPSRSGYGVFEHPSSEEFDQTETCLSQGYWQYDYPKYLTFGVPNDDLIYSNEGTKVLLTAILQEKVTGKVFIERHLRDRMGMKDNRLRFQGCRAVRHDDHIHIQLK